MAKSDSRPIAGSVLGEVDPLIGLTISGRYRVHTLVGQGGMGKVFRAQQIPLGRAVALKVLEAHRVDQEFHRRFFQEAAILAKLQSPHTVTIYDYGRDGDLYFIAMELVSGGSLDKVLAAEGALPIPRMLSIAQQICRSLREAHGKGVIHRDLKPANVVLARGEDGEEIVKVLDFGLAKRLNATIPEDTQHDVVPGSPKYMAPEVIRQHAIDGRADIYGLGVMMYQMLAGTVPFDRANAVDILFAHLHEQPVPPSRRNPQARIPPQLDALVMRCLAKNPDERFANVRELHDALLDLELELAQGPRSGRAPRMDPAPSGVRRSSMPRLRLTGDDLTPAPVLAATRRRGRALLAVGVLLALVVIAAVLLLQPAPAPPAAAAAPPAPLPVQEVPAAAAAPAVEPEAPAPAAAPEAAADMVFSDQELNEGPKRAAPARRRQRSAEPRLRAAEPAEEPAQAVPPRPDPPPPPSAPSPADSESAAAAQAEQPESALELVQQPEAEAAEEDEADERADPEPAGDSEYDGPTLPPLQPEF